MCSTLTPALLHSISIKTALSQNIPPASRHTTDRLSGCFKRDGTAVAPNGTSVKLEMVHQHSLPRLRTMPLARLHAPFNDPGWIFEPKLDGFRALLYIERGSARLVSRKGNTLKLVPALTREL